jgi:threonine/homoserine/homoserine lactone efflux protein
MLSGLWLVFSLAFVVALSGALAPGPLLTYTILRTLDAPRSAYHTGVRVIAGHALLEGALVALLLAGFSSVLRNPVTTRVIGTAGGLFLLVMGARLALDVLRGRVASPFAAHPAGAAPGRASGRADGGPERAADRPARSAAGVSNPVLGGILVSMSNPYWWVWWASIGLAFMLQYDITFRNWPLLLAFFAGHEAGDLLWYWLVSLIVSIGRRGITDRVYRIVLLACAAVMAGFGLYLGVSPYLAR